MQRLTEEQRTVVVHRFLLGYSGESVGGFDHMHMEMRDGCLTQDCNRNPWSYLPYSDLPNDLRIQQLGVKRAKVFGVRRLESQGVDDVERKLVPGRYRLWCSLPGHAEKGMVASLRTARRKTAD